MARAFTFTSTQVREPGPILQMASGSQNKCAYCTDTFTQWAVPWASSWGYQRSRTFKIGGFSWHLLCDLDEDRPHEYVSVDVCCAEVDGDDDMANFPVASATLTLLNHKDESKNITNVLQAEDAQYDISGRVWRTRISRDQISEESSFLNDGSLALCLRLEVRNPKPIFTDHAGACSDLLALLDDGGDTSDLTLVVGGGTGTLGGGSEGGSSKAAGTRSFPVHRAILAARCPYFRTLFGSGFKDSHSHELRMPDVEPDAMAVLLRYIYGGVMNHCDRAVLREAILLSRKLLLLKLESELERGMLESTDADKILGDLLWALQHDRDECLKQLIPLYKELAKDVEPDAVAAAAVASPLLAARLLVYVTQQNLSQEGSFKRHRVRY